MILTSDGKVFTFGSARTGTLGHDFEISAKNENLARQIDTLETEFITDVSLGDSHAAAINKDGELFCWGSRNHGKLGITVEKGNKRARRVRNYNDTLIKEPKKSDFFGTDNHKIKAEKVLCTNQNTFVIGWAFTYIIV